MSEYDLEKIKSLIKKCRWNWASTYLSVPHEYIHRDKCALSKDEFYYIVHAQREIGIHERWGKYNFPYLYPGDGYKYWTMGDTMPNTWILNRQKLFNEFDNLDWPIEPYYTDYQFKFACKAITETFPNRMFFEAGCGDGAFVRCSGISNNSYKGVDPSKKAVALFRERNGGFYRNVSCKSFEESIEVWSKKENNYVVIGLFGSPTYFMRQYINKLVDSHRDYFLMFFKDGFIPEQFKEMHEFRYTRQDLSMIFPFSYIYDFSKYIIVSTRSVDWNKIILLTNDEKDLFSV